MTGARATADAGIIEPGAPGDATMAVASQPAGDRSRAAPPPLAAADPAADEASQLTLF
jgi:hypothetical protein